MKKLILCLILFVLFAISVSANEWDLEYDMVEPVQYVIYDHQDVQFTLTANIFSSPEKQGAVNVNLYTKVNNTQPYRLTVSELELVNGGHVHTTVTFQNRNRVWWYWEFVDVHNNSIENTTIRLFDVELDYFFPRITEDWIQDKTKSIELLKGYYYLGLGIVYTLLLLIIIWIYIQFKKILKVVDEVQSVINKIKKKFNIKDEDLK